MIKRPNEMSWSLSLSFLMLIAFLLITPQNFFKIVIDTFRCKIKYNFNKTSRKHKQCL